jgi:glutathione S-transferase
LQNGVGYPSGTLPIEVRIMQANVVSKTGPTLERVATGETGRKAASARTDSAHTNLAKTNTIILHRFGPFLGAPDSSPFVIKTMMLLKLAGLAYHDVSGNPFRAPKKLLPYIQDGGAPVADSTLIRLHIERKYSLDFDAALSVEQKAVAWAVERMCEDHLYFAMLDARWRDPAAFRKGVGTMFGMVPAPLRPLAKVMLRRANAARLYGHGLGRHAKADIVMLATRDIDALASLIGDKPYLMGDKPCAADAFAFAIVTSILTPPLDGALRAAMAGHANLVAYRDRLTREFFPGLAQR